MARSTKSGNPANRTKPPAPADAVNRERRQRHIFDLYYLERLTYDEIEEATGLSRPTIASDLKIERERRAKELGAERDEAIALQLAMVEDVIKKARDDRHTQGTGAYGALTKALELRAKLLGLEAPTKIDVSAGRRVTFEVVDVKVEPIEEAEIRQLPPGAAEV